VPRLRAKERLLSVVVESLVSDLERAKLDPNQRLYLLSLLLGIRPVPTNSVPEKHKADALDVELMMGMVGLLKDAAGMPRKKSPTSKS